MYWVLYSVLCPVRKSPLWVQHSDVSKLDFFCQKLSIFFSLDLFLTIQVKRPSRREKIFFVGEVTAVKKI